MRLAGGGHPEEFSVMVSDRAQGISENAQPFRSSGSWRVGQLGAGSYEIRVTAAEGTANTTAQLAEGEQKLDVELVLEPKVDIKGRFVDIDTGAPIPGFWVQVSAASGSGWGFRGSGVSDEKKEISGEDGRFEVQRVPTGKVRIVAMPRSFGGSDYEQVVMQRSLPTQPSMQDLGDIRVPKRRTKENERGGDLGFSLKEVAPDEDWDNRTLEIALVRPDGPAADSGLEVGDIITSVDGHDVTGENTYLYGKLASVPAGTKVTLGLARGAKIGIVAAEPL